jgi:hypothetical protein
VDDARVEAAATSCDDGDSVFESSCSSHGIDVVGRAGCMTRQGTKFDVRSGDDSTYVARSVDRFYD